MSRAPSTNAAWERLRLVFGRLVHHRAFLLLLLVVIALVILHPVWLRMLAWPLQATDTPATFDYFCLHGGEMGIDGAKPFARAAEWRAEAAGRKILLLLPRTSRIVEIGALPSFEQTCRRELAKLGVPSDDVESVHAEARNAWDEAHALDDWIKQHPEAKVALGCSPFAGGRLSYAFDKVLNPPERSRLGLLPLYVPANPSAVWWQTRAGVKDFMYGWLDLLYARFQGDDARALQPNAAEFQGEVRAAIGEAPQ